ncbi:MAG: 4-hydroxybenzoate octaprenyltransferase [Acidobacteria bacterium]|nr:MAG: 4-hydroxybenzoate octaprenyltransferase [Acidobacteriota bacterium]
MKRLFIVLEMIKFEHTVFAIPFAFLGAFLAARGFPGWESTLWIILAMFGARSAAMGFNRVVDAELDSRNPRTANRALPLRLLTRRFVLVFVAFSSLLFFFAAWNLNPLALYLSPLALFIVLGYSYTKRFTSLSHLFLGLSLAIAPVGGWVAVRGELDVAPFYIAAAVVFWVAGFDIIYACQDVEFDRSARLYSLPSRSGIRRSLQISSGLHVVMVLLLVWTFWLFRLSLLSWIGLGLVVIGLLYEHSLVKAEDLSRVNAAFFTINGFISVILFVFVGADLCLFV